MANESLEKVKDKIQKLLDRSMLDSGHEAEIALEKATELMNRWNLDESDINGTKVVIQQRELAFFKWDKIKLMLINGICEVSDTANCYYSGRKIKYKKIGSNEISTFEKSAGVFITGRERDIENAIYLFDIILRNVTRAAQKYKLSIRNTKISKNNKDRIDAFRYGYIDQIISKLSKEKVKFFSENKALICIDSEVKLKEAKEKLKEINYKETDGISIDINENDFLEGKLKAKELDLANGVGNTNLIKIEHKG